MFIYEDKSPKCLRPDCKINDFPCAMYPPPYHRTTVSLFPTRILGSRVIYAIFRGNILVGCLKVIRGIVEFVLESHGCFSEISPFSKFTNYPKIVAVAKISDYGTYRGSYF